MIDVVTIGEILIDLVATQSDVRLFDAPAFEPKPGGAPANVAVGVARLGKSAAFIGKVGGDEFGQGLENLLGQEGVDTSGVLTDSESLTTLALVALSTGGEPHFAFAPGAHTRLQPEDIPQNIVRSARIVQFGSVSLAHEPVRTATLFAQRLAYDAGATVVYDINWRPFLYQNRPRNEALTILREPLAWCHVVKLNSGELHLLTDSDDVEVGLEYLAKQTPASLIVVTRGAKGCTASFRGDILHIAAPTITQVVDTTGAGDAFLAALLSVLPDHPDSLDTAELPSLLQYANAAGSMAVTRRGAIPALPSKAELSEFICR
jgi:fructokinase